MSSDIWNKKDLRPMLLKEIEKPFDSEDFIYEIKFDGIRALIYACDSGVKIISRNGVDMTRLYPELKCISKLVTSKVIIDGEIVVMRDGVPSFSCLQHRNRSIQNIGEMPVTFVAFDILYEDKVLTGLPLIKRKDILSRSLKENEFVQISKVFNVGEKLFENIKKLNLEGIVAKKKDSTYHINSRSDDWLKIKNYKVESFFVCAYSETRGNSISLALGEKTKKGLRYVGNVLLGKNCELAKKIMSSKKTLISPFNDEKIEEKSFLVSKIKVNVKYIEKTTNGKLRHAVIA